MRTLSDVPTSRAAALLGPLLAALLAPAGAARAVELRSPDGDLYAFPLLAGEDGKALATSTFEQWTARGRLHLRITHRFHDGRTGVERARFAIGRELVQEAWSWEERRGGEVLRAFEVDLRSGQAIARKRRDDGGEDRFAERVKVLPYGRTFAGVGVPYAVKNLRDRLVAGEAVPLRAVAFRPKPISVPIVVKHAARERIAVAGREVEADRFEVRLDLKGAEKLLDLVKHPAGADVWLHHGRPPMILRVRYPLAEPSDPVVVLDTLGRG